MIAPRIGLAVGPRVGPAVGVGADEIAASSGGGLAGVTSDATSGKYVPASAAEWTAFRTAKGRTIANPNSLWLCQEASGNLADSIGALPLVATNAPTYQAAAPGWSRVGAHTADATSQMFQLGIGVGPNASTTSSLWLGIFHLPTTPAANRSFFGPAVTASSGCRAALLNTGNLAITCVTVTTSSDTIAPGTVTAIFVKYDRTNSAVVVGFPGKSTPGTYGSVVADQVKGLAGPASGMPDATMLYGALWTGANAEVSNAEIQALLTDLGW